MSQALASGGIHEKKVRESHRCRTPGRVHRQRNALEGSPVNNVSSGLAIAKIKASAEYQLKIRLILSKYPNNSQIIEYEDDISFNTGDLYYAIHLAKMSYNGYKGCENKWDLFIHIWNTYNFNMWSTSSTPGAVLNNMAAQAQQAGILHTFFIDLWFRDGNI